MEPVGLSGAIAHDDGRARSQTLGVRVGRTGHLFELESGTPGRRLVLKLLPWSAGLPPGVVRDFTDEASRVATLRHPHVVPITDAGRLDDGRAFLVMERLHGQTLEERLEQRGALAPAEVISIVRGVAAALSVAHAAGVIHREIRADNVFIEDHAGHPHGFARVLDFGVARLTAAARAAGRVVRDGSAGEAAPELRRDRGDGADHRADQFALAALAFRLLHGITAPAGAPGGAAFERLWDEPAHWQVADKPANPALEGVLARAMSWRADSRFDSVASFFCAFEDALAARPALADVVAPPRAPAAPPVSGVVVAPPPVPAAPPASLTQQFFAEGDRLEAAASQPQSRADARSATDDGDDENAEDAGDTEEPARSGTFERVPRRLAPLIGAVALGLVALAIIAHAAVRASRDGAVPWARESAALRSPVSPAPGVVLSPTTTTFPAAASAGATAANAGATSALARSRPATAAPRSGAASPPLSAAATQPPAAPTPTATPAAALPSPATEPSPPPPAVAPASAAEGETAGAAPAESKATAPAETAEPAPSGESGAASGERPSAPTQAEGPL